LEGWGLYAENPLISDDTDVYDGEPMKKYGMLKWQVGKLIKSALFSSKFLILKIDINAWYFYVSQAIPVSIWTLS